MTTLGPFSARRERRSRRDAAAVRWGLRLLLAAVIFALGVALGQALEQNAGDRGTQTVVRTVRPLPLPPATTITVIAPTG